MIAEFSIPLLALAIFAISAALGLCAGYALWPKPKPCAGDCVRRGPRFTEPPKHPACVDCVRVMIDPACPELPKCDGSFDPVTGDPGHLHCGDMQRQGCGPEGRYFKSRKHLPYTPGMTLKPGESIAIPIDIVRGGKAAESAASTFDDMRDRNRDHHQEVRDKIAKGLSGDGPCP